MTKFDVVDNDYEYHPYIANEIYYENKLYENWAGFE